MNTIWKFAVPVAPEFTLDLPTGSSVLSVQTQGAHGLPHLWVEVDTDPTRPRKARHFRLFGTGHPIENPLGLRYIGTFQMEDGNLVFHLYEKMSP